MKGINHALIIGFQDNVSAFLQSVSISICFWGCLLANLVAELNTINSACRGDEQKVVLDFIWIIFPLWSLQTKAIWHLLMSLLKDASQFTFYIPSLGALHFSIIAGLPSSMILKIIVDLL